MAQVIIALGSNLQKPRHQLVQAKEFLENLSVSKPRCSGIYQSEAVGLSSEDFLNAVIEIETRLGAEELFEKLKEQERRQGRPTRYPKWTARTLDLDIIDYNHLVIETDTLIIPHAEYKRRLFVLLPLKELLPDWQDPQSAQHIDDMINSASQIRISKTNLSW